MKPRDSVNATREVKRETYAMLRHLHDLERASARAKVVRPCCPADPCVVVMLRGLNAVLSTAMVGIQGESVAPAVQTFLGRLARMETLVDRNTRCRRPLRKGDVAKLLQSHTKAFRRMADAGVDIRISGERWIDAVGAAVSIWGNSL